MTYVDDLLLLGKDELAKKWVKEIQKKWEVSEPEKVEEKAPTRFLGMELSRDGEGRWHAKQEAYTKDLLLRNLGPEPMKWPKRKIPITKEDDGEAEMKEEPGRTPAEVKEAQRVVGELIWLKSAGHHVCNLVDVNSDYPKTRQSDEDGVVGVVLLGWNFDGRADLHWNF